jgi:hypothetical protein
MVDLKATNSLDIGSASEFTVDASGNMAAAGTGSFGGNVDLNSNKITELADGTAASDAINLGQLNAEVTARTNADTTLQTNIDAEATARANADTTLQANIDAEATSRANADTTLQANIDAEVTARTNADATIQAEVDVCIHADGSVAFTADQSMGNFRITDLADGSLSTDAVTYGQLSAVSSGLNWRPAVSAITADVALQAASDGTSLTSLLPFDDDEGTAMGLGDFSEGDYILSLNTSGTDKLFKVVDDLGTLKVTTFEVQQPTSGDAYFVHNDLPDSPSDQENSGVYAYNGTDLVKVGDIDWALATGIDIDAGYAAEAGTVASGISVFQAIEYLDGNDAAEATARANADTTLQANIDAEATARANADTTLQANIDAEATARANADTTLQANIDAEATARAAADTSIRNDLASTSNGFGASLIGVEDAAATFTATDVEGVLLEIDGRLDTLEGADVTETLQEAYVAGASIDASASEGDIHFLSTSADAIFDVDLAAEFANIDINAQFKIGGVATSANVTSANLNTLTAGSTSNADSLHTHAGSALSMTAGTGGIAQYDAVKISGNDTVLKAQADALANAAVIGFSEAAIAESSAGNISLNGAVIEGVLSGATAGAKYYLSAATAGAISTTVPTGSGEVILQVGYAKNATDLFCMIGDPKVRA